jgi:hypothetical protein
MIFCRKKPPLPILHSAQTRLQLPKNTISIYRGPIIRNPRIIRTSSIIEDVNALISSNIQDKQGQAQNGQLRAIINPKNIKIHGPVNSDGTSRLRNHALIKCPPGSRRNQLNQCITI